MSQRTFPWSLGSLLAAAGAIVHAGRGMGASISRKLSFLLCHGPVKLRVSIPILCEVRPKSR